MAIESLLFKIGADVSEMEKGFEEAKEKVEKLTQSLEAVGSALAFEKLVEGFKDLVNESADAELAVRKFYNGMKAGGQALDVGLFDEFAESFEKLTGSSKDATFAAANVLTRFHATQDQIEEILPAAADLSASLGISLSDAAERMGHAAVEGGRGLMSLGLGFDQQAKKAFEAADQTTRLEMITARVGETIKGTAELVNGSAVGSLKQYDNATKELKESLGGIIEVPFAAAVQKMTAMVQMVTQAFNNLSPGVKAFLGDFAMAVVTVGGVASGLAALTTAIGAVVAIAPIIGSSLVGALTAAATTLAPIVLGFAAIVLVIGIVRTAVDTLREVWASNMDDIQGKVASVVDYVKDLYEQFMKLTGLAWALQKIKELLPGGTKVVGEVASGLAAGAAAVKGVLTTGATGVVEAFKAGMGTIGDVLDGVFNRGSEKVKNAMPNLVAHPAAAAAAAAAPAASPLAGYSIQQLASGDPLAEMVKQKAEAAGAAFVAAFGSGKEAQEKAAAFLKGVEEETGLSAASLSTITQKFGSSANDVVDVADHLHDMSDQSVKNLLDIPGITKDAVVQIADEMKQLPQIIKDAAAKAKGIVDAGGGVGPDGNPGGDALSGLKQGIGYETTSQPQGAGTKFASNLAGKLGGDFGTTIQAGIQGGAAGGPIGAAAAAGLDLLTKTKSFSKLTGALSDCMHELTGALEPLVQVLAIVLTALKPLFQIVGSVLGVVMGALLKYVEGLAYVYNTIIGIINKVIGFFNSKAKLATIDVHAIENTDNDTLSDSSKSASDSLNGVSKAADTASNSITNATQGFKSSAYMYAAANDQLAENKQELHDAYTSGQIKNDFGNGMSVAAIKSPVQSVLGSLLTQPINRYAARPAAPPATSPAYNPGPTNRMTVGHNITMNVSTSDPATLSRKLKDQMETENFRAGMSSQSNGNPYSSARTV